MKKFVIVLSSLLIALSCTAVWSATKSQRDVAGKVVRLHVLAHSDSEEDQRKKLLVRDAVLAAAEECLADCNDREEAEQALREALPSLEAVGEEALGGCYAVSADLSREMYPLRHYESFSLPAGEYLSLQVRIGAGEGKNWWCVVFPPLCLAATTEEMENAALEVGLNGEEIAFMTEQTPETVVRFKILDWISALMT